MRMDRATRLLRSNRLRVNEECTGWFGVLKRNWWICAQAPHAGKRVKQLSVVTIFGARRGEYPTDPWEPSGYGAASPGGRS